MLLASWFELVGTYMPENVNKFQHFEACLHFLATECRLTQVRLPYGYNQLYTNTASQSVTRGENSQISSMQVNTLNNEASERDVPLFRLDRAV